MNSALRTSGLVLGDKEVLQAMEKTINGEYVPVKLDKNGFPDRNSACISKDGMAHLKNYIFKKLTDMAESVFSGDVEAVPLALDGKMPCSYCNYINICDNSEMTRYREPVEADIAEVQAILDNKYSERGD